MGDGSRRFHAKSKNGCGQCKKRRVKCSMQGPICAHCKRRGERCDYLDRISTTDYMPASAKLTPNIDAAVSPDVLLSHYMQATSGTLDLIDEEDSGLSPWRQELTPFIQSLPFLHHIVLSLSALHIYYLHSGSSKSRDKHSTIPRALFIQEINPATNFRPSSSYSAISAAREQGMDPRNRMTLDEQASSPLVVAYANQITGSAAFRNSIPAVDSTNWFPILAFAIATLVFRLETCRRATTFSGLVTDVLAALRSAAIAGEEIRPFFLNSGALGDYLMSRARQAAPPLHPSMSFALARLKTLNDEWEVTNAMQAEEQSLCAQAIDALQRWMIFVSGKPRTWLHYIWWPADVPPEFIELISEKRPGPLLVFVHWCAIMHGGAQRWFLHGWAPKAAAVAMAEIGDYPGWEEGLEWPRIILGKNTLLTQ